MMHVGIAKPRWRENVPGACATRNFAYMAIKMPMTTWDLDSTLKTKEWAQALINISWLPLLCRAPLRPLLTHWGRVTHICVSKLTIIVSDNDLAPDRCQAVIWTSAGVLFWTLRNKLQWNRHRNSGIFVQENAFENVVWKMATILSPPQCVNITRGRRNSRSLRLFSSFLAAPLLDDAHGVLGPLPAEASPDGASLARFCYWSTWCWNRGCQRRRHEGNCYLIVGL